jgi:hypothetical protein
MLCKCASIKAKKFKFYCKFDVQPRNNHVFDKIPALLEASRSIEEDFVLIVRNIIVASCCCCFKRAFLSALQHTLLTCRVFCDTRRSHYTLHIALRDQKMRIEKH